MPEPTDEELMVRAREGEIDAFRDLTARHQQWVERFLYHMLWDREAAEDGAQEVLVKVWLARERYEPTAQFTTFLFTCARNWCRNAIGRHSRGPAVVPLEEQLGPTARAVLDDLTTPEDVPERELLRGYERFRIRRAIAALPEPQRAVFVLSQFDDLTYAEIARMLEVPEGTVKSRMHHACRKLREALSEEE